MKRIIDFLGKLDANNNRPWFQEHKEEYKACKEMFDGCVMQMIEAIRKFDPSIGLLTAADCTYRIYRDTRFSPDKTPYKAHFGAFIAPEGKKSGYCGYYFQIGARSGGLDAGSFLAAGDYRMEPEVLRILREDIDIDSDEEFRTAIATAENFYLDRGSELKRIPKGYDASHPRADLLRLRNFCLLREVDHSYFLKPDWQRRLAADFSTTAPFLHLINRAIAYSREQG